MEESVATRLAREFEITRPRFVALADAMRVLLAQLAADESIAVDSVTGRAKDQASLTRKLKNPKYTSLNDITDLCGLRVVVRHAEDVHGVVELLKQEFDVLEHVVHGAQSPEAFGYSSEHLILRLDGRRGGLREWRAHKDLVVEVQVRSILQHAWASISHGLDYKTESEAPVELRRQLFRIAALLETSDELFDSFRRQMMETRGTYQESVMQDQWRNLPLDIDSFRAAESEWPWRRLVETALQNGFRTGQDPDESVEGYLGYVGNPEDGAGGALLIRIAQSLGMQTLGELRAAADELLADPSLLIDLVRESESRGGAPYPVPADVLTLYLLVSRPSQQAFAELNKSKGQTLIKHLVESAREVAFGREK